jgi:catechol 2,3-dioxygenase
MGKHFLSHLAHVELITPKLDQSVTFFKTVMGMEEVARTNSSVYLRCWSDYYHSSLILSEGAQPALGHASWRTHGADELTQAVASLEAMGAQGEWVNQSVGHGPAYRFQIPGGHPLEIFWEVEKYQGNGSLKSEYPDRPQKHRGYGIEPRQLDHITIATRDVRGNSEWVRDALGFRNMAYIAMDHDPNMFVFGVNTTNEKSHDLGMAADFSGVAGRIHHLAFWLESNDDMYRAADLLIEHGTPVEYGVGRHGIGEQTYLYFREPGGMRIELNSGGYRNYVPDWQPHVWKGNEGPNSMFRNLAIPESMMEAFPPAKGAAIGEPELAMARSINVQEMQRKH